MKKAITVTLGFVLVALLFGCAAPTKVVDGTPSMVAIKAIEPTVAPTASPRPTATPEPKIGEKAYYEPMAADLFDLLQLPEDSPGRNPLLLKWAIKPNVNEDYSYINPAFPEWLYEVPYNVDVKKSDMTLFTTNKTVLEKVPMENIKAVIDEAQALAYCDYGYNYKDKEEKAAWLENAKRVKSPQGQPYIKLLMESNDANKAISYVKTAFDPSLVYVDGEGRLTVRGIVFVYTESNLEWVDDVGHWEWILAEYSFYPTSVWLEQGEESWKNEPFTIAHDAFYKTESETLEEMPPEVEALLNNEEFAVEKGVAA